jgi:signal transduction histidine kinase
VTGGTSGGGLPRLRGALAQRPVLVDGAFALVLALTGVRWLLREGRHPNPWMWVLEFGLYLPLAWRRRVPFSVFCVVAAVALGQWLAGALFPPGDLALLVALYAVGAYSRWRSTLLAWLVLEVGVALAIDQWAAPGSTLKAFVMLSGVTTAAAVIGVYMRTRLAYHRSLEDRAARLERERDQQAQIAAAAERSRIAREVHDIVTHSLSVMVALSDGAVFAARSSPEQAVLAMEKSAGIGREAIEEMRRLLGVLRNPGGDGAQALHPQPGIAQLEELLAQVRAAGLATEFVVDGDRVVLPPGLQLVVYRIVQEALTNTRKHAGAGASARVRLGYGVDGLVVEVSDNGRGVAVVVGGGHGLTGMRERAAVCGGSVEAGPSAMGGWRVRVLLPLDGAP